jgi:hypothetical protein
MSLQRLARACAAALAVSAGACADLDSVTSPDAVLTLTATPQALAANGYATATIVAQIDPRTDERYRDISFHTTLGRFPAGTSPGATSIVATAGSEGRASVTLQAAAQVGIATVTAEIREGDAVKASRQVEIPFQPVPASEVIVLEVGRFEAPADGSAVTDLIARLDPSVPREQRTVTFSTTLGSLGAPNVTTREVLADSTNEARVGLISPRELGTALVTATLNGLAARARIAFTPALPHSMSLRAIGSLKLMATFSTKVPLAAELFRESGTVTRGTEVSFEAVDDTTRRSFGFFSGVTPSDIAGNVTAEFTPGNTTERGEATLTARVEGTRVSSSVKVEIVDPPPVPATPAGASHDALP